MADGNRAQRHPRPGEPGVRPVAVLPAPVVLRHPLPTAAPGARVVVDVMQEGLTAVMQISGGRDGQHRQLLLLRALESEMRQTMAFAQRVRDLMEQDEDARALIQGYLEAREAEENEAREKAAAEARQRVVAATEGDMAVATRAAAAANAVKASGG